MKKYLVLVSGPQGSGKSTQAELIAKQFNAPIFEAGVELRSLVERSEPGATEVEAYMKRGDLVPHRYVDKLFGEFFTRNFAASVLVSDGYPRNLPELEIAEQLCGEDRTIIGLNVQLDEATSIERIMARAKSSEESRPDNAADAIKKRLRLYHEETVPVLERVKSAHQLIVIDGQPSIEVVRSAVSQAINPILTA